MKSKCLAAFFALVCFCAGADIYIFDPRASFLRGDNDPGRLPAEAFDLAHLSFQVLPGTTWLRLSSVGDYSVGLAPNQPDTTVGCLAIFSSTSELLAVKSAVSLKCATKGRPSPSVRAKRRTGIEERLF